MSLLIDTDIVCYSSCYAAKDSDFLLTIDYCENLLYKILAKFPEQDYDLYLTGKNNFRYKVADYYKAHRTQPKPKYLSALRDYLIQHWDAIVTDGDEADDAIGRRVPGNIVCSIDKDFLQIPGIHYNFRKDEIIEISEEDARLNFWVQMLTGDTADNIPGIKNPAKAHHKNPPNFSDASAREILIGSDYRQTVEMMYEAQYREEWEKEFDIHATLLFIQRKDAKTYKECNLLYPKHVCKYVKREGESCTLNNKCTYPNCL